MMNNPMIGLINLARSGGNPMALMQQMAASVAAAIPAAL